MAVDSSNQEVLTAIADEASLPGNVIVLSLSARSNKHAVEQLLALDGSQVYRR
jgi:hypothetical protein